MEAPVKASGEEEAQPIGLSQLAFAPSSNDAILDVGIQVQHTRYLLLEIDGLIMWQWYGQRRPLRDNLGMTYRAKCITSLGLPLRKFWSSV